MVEQIKYGRIVIESGIDRGMVFPISDDVTTVGRSPSNSIQVIDRKASRHHAAIHYKEEEFVLKDLGSKNGTYVNNKLITEDVVLNNGDQVKIGETFITFECEPRSEVRDTTTKPIKISSEPSWGKMEGAVKAGEIDQVTVEIEKVPESLIKDSSRRLEILYSIAEAIRNILNLNELLNKIMDIIFEVLKPDRAFIMLKDDKTGELAPRVVKKKYEDEEEITISHTIVDRSLRDNITVLVTDAAEDQRFKTSESVIVQGIRSAICAPLIYKDDILGVIYIDSKKGVAPYEQAELELLNGIANQAAVAIANTRFHGRLVDQHKLEKEMEIARSIQMNLLPREYPEFPGFEISAMSLPAKKVGGDYYDFVKIDEQRWGFAVADVSGKGVPAAILIASVRAALRSELNHPKVSIDKIMERLNSIAIRDVASNMFVTMIFGILDAKNKVFEYCNAGHCYPLFFDPQARCKVLETSSSFLGLMDKVRFDKVSFAFKPGATLLLYSDGVTDTMNPKGDLFGLERLKNVVKDNYDLPVQELRNTIYNTCLAFKDKAEVFDDFTVVIIRASASP